MSGGSSVVVLRGGTEDTTNGILLFVCCVVTWMRTVVSKKARRDLCLPASVVSLDGIHASFRSLFAYVLVIREPKIYICRHPAVTSAQTHMPCVAISTASHFLSGGNNTQKHTNDTLLPRFDHGTPSRRRKRKQGDHGTGRSLIALSSPRRWYPSPIQLALVDECNGSLVSLPILSWRPDDNVHQSGK